LVYLRGDLKKAGPAKGIRQNHIPRGMAREIGYGHERIYQGSKHENQRLIPFRSKNRFDKILLSMAR